MPTNIDRAVSSLEVAVRRAPSDAALLNDLALAYLARGERDQQLRPVLQALETIDRARALNDTMVSVLFNRALILERLYLRQTALVAWTKYLAIERDSAWRREAEAHVRSLSQMADTGWWTTDSVASLAGGGARTEVEVARFVERAPQSARDAGFGLLGEWGRAILRADTSGARRALVVTRQLAGSFDAVGGDRSLSLALTAIDANGASVGNSRALAQAHADLADGYGLYIRAAYNDAATRLERAERAMRALGSPAAGWAALFQAASLVNQGDYDRADHILQRVRDEATPAAPALLGKAVWSLGLSQVRRGAYEAATRQYRTASPYIIRARESENLGMISALLTESLELAGQSSAGRDEALRALHLLAPYRRSRYLSNHLGLIVGYARSDQLHLAALDVMGELLELAPAVRKPQFVALARSERARDLLAIGRPDEARAELDAAMAWADSISPGAGRDQFRADIMLVRGQLLRATDPQEARAELGRVITAYRESHAEIKLPNALYQTALLARETGDTAAARHALHEAIRTIEARRAWFPTAEIRATFFETMEGVFDAMIALELDANRPDTAFAYLERSRAAAWAGDAERPHTRSVSTAARGIRALQRRIQPNVLAVEYALLPDRVVAWTIASVTSRHYTFSVSRDSVAAIVTRFHAESGVAESSSASARSVLFDLLLRPILRDHRGVTSVVIIPDRELSRLPFVALWDHDRQRYVVEDFSVRTLPSAAFFDATSVMGRDDPEASRSALVIGDPAFDSVLVPRLGRLPGSAREAVRVAELYPSQRTLTGTAVLRDSLLALLPSRSIFHFAGHAIANGEQPELSFLALAANRTTDDGILRAREIGRLRLSNVKLVVLSACSTLGARPTHVGAIAGLAYSFLRAGARATISSLWDVDDEMTTTLLVAFHRRFAEGSPAPDALRAAQLDALHSPNSGLQAPRAWAAFIYTGP